MAGTALATEIITAVNAYIAGLSAPKGDNIVRQDLFEALFGSIEDWVGIQGSVTSVSANTVLTAVSPRTTKMTTGAGDKTITLPPGTTVRNGARFRASKVDAGAGGLSLLPAGADTINGVTAAAGGWVMQGQYSYAEVEWLDGYWTITPGGPMEHGTHPTNGEWITFSNGLQICWGTISGNAASGIANYWGTASGMSYYWTGTRTFAKAFASAPKVVGTITGSTSYTGAMSAVTITATNFVAYVGFRGLTTNPVTADYIAIGWA